jgi:glucosamine--fructose-6-phosphate aminotransferase (isomerizing)
MKAVSLMLDEIREQPAALERTLARERKAARRLRARFEKNRPRWIVLAARGTSDNAAQFGRYLIETSAGIPVSLAAPSVYTLYEARLDLRGALVIAISQSGESTDVNLVLERAKASGAMCIGITNEAGSTLAKLASDCILVRAGKEKSVAATKTYTGQLLAMYLIAQALGAPIKERQLDRLPELAAKALKSEPLVHAESARFHYMERALVVGRGLNYANAFEMALKMMETCYVVAERFSSADLLHGPIAMVGQAFPAFVFAPPGVTWTPIREALDRLRHSGAARFVITDRGNPEAAKTGARSVVLPMKLEEIETPIPYIIPAQLFAAHLAAEKGLNPDQPRSLTKVTRTI